MHIVAHKMLQITQFSQNCIEIQEKNMFLRIAELQNHLQQHTNVQTGQETRF